MKVDSIYFTTLGSISLITLSLARAGLAAPRESVEAQARERRGARGRREGGGELLGRERRALLVVEAEEAAVGQRGTEGRVEHRGGGARLHVVRG